MSTSTLDTVSALAAEALANAGVHEQLTDVRPMAGGQDNALYCGVLGGRPVVVKRAQGRTGRFAGAAAAGELLAAAGIPVADVIAYTDRIGIEARCAGGPLDDPPMRATSPGQWQAAVAVTAGGWLRRLHALPAARIGRLFPSTRDEPGYRTIRQWRGAFPGPPADADLEAAGALADARQVLQDTACLLKDPDPRVLHGDWVAAHVIACAELPAVITGLVDLQSVRGGDPLVELAGWSLQEPATLTAALFQGYGVDLDEAQTRLRLTVNRVRVAASLLVHHLRTGQHASAAVRVAQLRHDVHALRAGQPAALPAITPEKARTL